MKLLQTLIWFPLLVLLSLSVPASLLAQPLPQEVKTGIYVINVYDLGIDEHTYHIDFYIWFKWKGALDPMNVEFINAVDKWDITSNLFYDEAIELEDGSLYNGMRYEGRFYHAFDLERFPLDKHAIDVQIEHVDYGIDSLVYLPDDSSYVREDLVLPGWRIKGIGVTSKENQYPMNFGQDNQPRETFSKLIFELELVRPFNYFLLKLLLPILIVVSVSLGALLITPVNIDARISLPIGGVLSAVFLQQSYSSALPDVGYMVLMDKIYLLVYALITATLLRVLLMGNRVLVQKKTINIDKVWKSDRRFSLILMALLLLGIGLLMI